MAYEQLLLLTMSTDALDSTASIDGLLDKVCCFAHSNPCSQCTVQLADLMNDLDAAREYAKKECIPVAVADWVSDTIIHTEVPR